MAEALRKLIPVQDEAPEAPVTRPVAPTPIDSRRDKPAPAEPMRAPKRRRWTRWGLFALLPLVLAVGFYWYTDRKSVV